MTTNSASHRQKEDIKARWGVAEEKGARERRIRTRETNRGGKEIKLTKCIKLLDNKNEQNVTAR